MRSNLFLGAFLLFTFLTAPVQAVEWTFPDTARDMRFPSSDLTALRTELSDGRLTITLQYGKDLGFSDINFGALFIDGDANPDTGRRLGADAIIEFLFSSVSTSAHLALAGRTIRLGEEGTSMQVGSDSLRFTLPMSLWNGVRPPLVFATSSWTLGSTDYDRLPDAGWLDTESGLAVLPQPGNPLVHLTLADPPGDSVFPDLTAFEAQVSEGNLLLWLTFAHGVEKADLQNIQDILVINLLFDLDERLFSGFINNHEDPPALGADRDLRIMLSHLFPSAQATLRARPTNPDSPLADPLPPYEETGIGDQYNDTRCIAGQNALFHTTRNQIFLSIPLAYLGYADGEFAVQVTAFLESTLGQGHFDQVPDHGALLSRPGLTGAVRQSALAAPQFLNHRPKGRRNRPKKLDCHCPEFLTGQASLLRDVQRRGKLNALWVQLSMEFGPSDHQVRGISQHLADCGIH